MVRDFWKCGFKYFTLDLDDGEARMCLSQAKASNVNVDAYCVEMHPYGKVYYVDFIKVSPQYRNKGYGSALLKASLKWADVAKNVLILDAIPLDGGIDQHRLTRFYLKHGFHLADPKNNTKMYYHNRTKPRVTKRNMNKPLQ